MGSVGDYLLNKALKWAAGILAPVFVVMLVIVIAAAAIFSIDRATMAQSDKTTSIAKGEEYLYSVDVDPQKMRSWLSQRCPGSPFVQPGQMEYFVTYGRKFDVNPIFALAITGTETTFGTAGGGIRHKAPFNISCRARDGDWWPCTDTWSTNQTWCAYDSLPDFEGGIHDAMLYLGAGYLHSKADWAAKGFRPVKNYFYDQGGGSNPAWVPGDGGVMEASKADTAHKAPNILGCGIIYCEGSNRFPTPQAWDAAGAWPKATRDFFNSCMDFCGVTSADAAAGGPPICIDPGHSPETRSEIDAATGLDVGDNSGDSDEVETNFAMASLLKAQLEGMGYGVVCTKSAVDQYVNLRQRADMGNGCAVMVRLHFDPSYHAVMYPPAGAWRAPGADPGRRTYVDPSVAASSRDLADRLATCLTQFNIQGSAPDTSGSSQNNVAGSPTALIGSVLSKVPTVCIESDPAVVSLSHGASQDTQQREAVAIAQGIADYVGPPATEDVEDTGDVAASDMGRALCNEAKRHLGAPYVWGAAGPDSFDCSGLVVYSMRQIGYPGLPRVTTYTIRDDARGPRRYFVEISESELQPGDLLQRSDFGHIAIYLGDVNGTRFYLHSPHTGDVVRVAPYDPSRWGYYFRLVPPK